MSMTIFIFQDCHTTLLLMDFRENNHKIYQQMRFGLLSEFNNGVYPFQKQHQLLSL